MSLSRRRFLGAAASSAALLAGAEFWYPAYAGEPDLSFVHPELRSSAETILNPGTAMPDPSAEALPALRAEIRKHLAPPPMTPAFFRESVKRGGSDPDVTVYVINSDANRQRPAIIHTHGGGFILGSAESSIAQLQPLAAALDCVVVSIEYRLAPETTFAGSMEDNYAALKWVYENASRLGVDRKRLALLGESAGGGHAALLAITARDRGEIPLVFQVLIYPMLDDRTGSVTQPKAPVGAILWTAARNRFGWSSFLGQQPGTASVPVKAVPARTASLAGLPPAFIGVGSIDLFVDEDVEFARRLIDEGIATELHVVPGAFHGFDVIVPQAKVSQEFTAAKIAALRRAFEG